MWLEKGFLFEYKNHCGQCIQGNIKEDEAILVWSFLILCDEQDSDNDTKTILFSSVFGGLAILALVVGVLYYKKPAIYNTGSTPEKLLDNAL